MDLLKHISVQTAFVSGQCKPFPVQRWVRPNFHYKIRAYDTILPQDDPNKSQRALGLEYKQTLYKYSGRYKGLPALIEKIPSEEEFSGEYFMVSQYLNEWKYSTIFKLDLPLEL